MPDNRQSERNPLTPTEGQRSVSPRSTLASRGLDLALTVQRENEEAVTRPMPKHGLAEEEVLLPSRTLRFPTEYSMGTLRLRRWNSPIVTWADIKEAEKEAGPDSWLKLGKARGEVHIPSGGEVELVLPDDEKFDLLPLKTFAPHDVQSITLNWWERWEIILISDEDMKCLQELTGLLRLRLSDYNVTDEGLEFLQNLNSLRWLDLSGTAVSDPGLASLAHLENLERLYLGSTHVTDAGLPYLRGLQNLKWLGLSGTAVSDAGVASLQHALPDCGIYHEDKEE